MYTDEQRQIKLEKIFLDLIDKAIELVDEAEMRDVPSIISLLDTAGVSDDAMIKLKDLNDRLIERLEKILDDAMPSDISVINTLIKKNRKSFKVKEISHEEEMEGIMEEIKKEEKK